jgi:hypothetical protein
MRQGDADLQMAQVAVLITLVMTLKHRKVPLASAFSVRVRDDILFVFRSE